MKLNIFFRELRSHLKSFIVWSVSMLFLIAAGMMKYSAYSKTGEAVNEIFDQLPAGVLKVMGFEPGTDFSNAGVFYSIFFIYFIMLMVVHSCMLGSSIIIKEERDKTADFLLVKPIKRWQIVTSKVVAASLMVILFNLLTFISSVWFVEPYNTSGESLVLPILRLCIALLIIQFIFLGVGFFLGSWAKRAERASGLATSIIMGTFLLKVLIDLRSELDGLIFLTPFKYFNSYHVMFDGDLNPVYIVLSVCISIAATVLAYLFFQKRDIHI